MSASFFWEPFETVINNYDDLVQAIEGILTKAKSQNKQFAWRGQVNSDWALHSSLYRRLSITTALNPIEKEFSKEENKNTQDK